MVIILLAVGQSLNKLVCNWDLRNSNTKINSDLWFWTSKVVARALDSSNCIEIRRHIWVGKHTASKILSLLFFRYKKLTLLPCVPMLQLSCSWVFNAWYRWWKDWYLCLRCSVVGAGDWTPSSWLFTTEPYIVGMRLLAALFLFTNQNSDGTYV